MLFGTRGPRSTTAKQAKSRLRVECLEERLLMAIDIGSSQPPTLPNIATAPFGVALAGATQKGAGFSVTNVGDVIGNGYDDFLVGAPTVTSTGGAYHLGGGSGVAYLIFGSSTVNAGNINWLLNNAQNRVGQLENLGQTTQSNPINGLPLANGGFNGVTFITSQEPQSQLGASGASIGTTASGAPAFIIGAPGGTDVNGANPGTGRAYLIYGGAKLAADAGRTIDLDNLAGVSNPPTVVTFVNNNIGARTGRSVTGIQNFFSGGADVAIGAPGASINGVGNTGAVYLLQGSRLPNATTTINLATVGQTGGQAGVVLVGANGGDQVGFSLSDGGNFDAAKTVTGLPVDALLIGAPQTNTGAGEAFVVYGTNTLLSAGITTSGFSSISLSRITSTTNTIAGAVFTGANSGDLTGFSVANAGDFNADGVGDILIGAPGASSNAGAAYLIYGAAGTSRITGSVNLGNIPSTINYVQFTGAASGNFTGYSLSLVGKIDKGTGGNDILIGAPGFNNLSGAVYFIPGNTGLFGVQSLSSAESQPIAGTLVTNSTPNAITPGGFGTSVSGRLNVTGQTLTADGDAIPDFVVGAPGYAANTTFNNGGGAFILQGAYFPTQIPVSQTITTTIGVGAAPPGPFSVNATTPDSLQIYVESVANPGNGLAPFDPVTQINPATVVVNGVAFPNATITKDPKDENGDGIEDAIITITPRSNLNLVNGSQTFTISGRTLSTGTNPNVRWTGNATITVVGGTSGGGGGGGAVTSLPGTFTQSKFIAPFGSSFVPTVAALSAFAYSPLPYNVAYLQYLPKNGFLYRQVNFFRPTHATRRFAKGNHGVGKGIFTLPMHVFTRSRYHAGNRRLFFTHRIPVIPISMQHGHKL